MNARRWYPNFPCLFIAATRFGSASIVTIFGFYYVKVFLEHFKISPSWLSVAQLIYLVWAISIEPLIGYAQDYGCNLWFRNRKRAIGLSGSLAAASFLIPWINLYDPSTAPQSVVGVHLTITLILWATCTTALFNAYDGYFAEVSNDPEFRNKLFKYQSAGQLLGSLFVFPVERISESLTNLQSFRLCAIGIALFAVCCFGLTWCKGPVRVAQADVTNQEELETLREQQERKPIFRIIFEVIRQKEFWLILVSNFCCFLRLNIIINFTAIFTEILVSGNTFVAGSLTLAVFYAMTTTLPKLALICVAPLNTRLGPEAVLLIGYALTWVNSGIGLFCGTFIGYECLLPTILTERILASFGYIHVLLFSKFIDSDAKRYSRKLPASSVVFSLSSTLTKPSAPLSPIIVTHILNLGNFGQFQHGNSQDQTMKNVVLLILTCLPSILASVAFLSMSIYRYFVRRSDKNRD